MDITPILKESAQRITAYSDEMVRVNEQEYHQSIIITPTEVLPWDGEYEQAQSLATHLGAASTGLTEIILLGTGKSFCFMPPQLQVEVKRLTGCALEVMDNAAACRTYNVLLAEGREVAAAIVL